MAGPAGGLLHHAWGHDRDPDVLRLTAAVASGEVNAQENPLTNHVGFGLHKHHRFVSLTGHIQGVALLAWHAG